VVGGEIFFNPRFRKFRAGENEEESEVVFNEEVGT
jgi:hypothetical protein